MKVFVTGATGFIGQALTRQLLNRNWIVHALVRHPQSPQAQAIKGMGAILVEGDIVNVDSMRNAMKDADIVIHNAAVYEYGVSGEKKKRMYDANVTGTDNVLGLAFEFEIPRTVYVSTTIVYGDTGVDPFDERSERLSQLPTYYFETESLAHDIAEQYMKRGLKLMIACPNGVVGPNDHSVLGYFLRMYLNHMLTPIGWGANDVTALVHVDDLAEGLALIAEKGKIGEVYFLAGEPITRRKMLDLWAKAPGGFKVRAYLPRVVASLLFSPMAPLLRLMGLPAFISRETISGIRNLNHSSQKAQTELGWTFRSAEQLWAETIKAEIELKKKRNTRNPIALLKPM